MRGKLFLVHWNEAEAADYAEGWRRQGWEVRVEASDGARAYRSIRESPPDVVVVYLTRLPSHGRETAAAIRSVKALRGLPIVVVGGQGEALEKARAKVPDALYVAPEALGGVLDTLAPPPASR